VLHCSISWLFKDDAGKLLHFTHQPLTYLKSVADERFSLFVTESSYRCITEHTAVSLFVTAEQ